MDIRDRVYSIKEVEELLGIPRTKIRHYLDKRLIDIERDGENGYFLYHFDDLMRISQIVYYRDVLGYSVEETATMLNIADAKRASALAEGRAHMLRADIEQHMRQLRMLEFNVSLINHQREFKDRIALVPFDTVYSFPYAYYIMSTHPLWSIMFGASEFSFDGESLSYERMRCVIFGRDLKYLPDGIFDVYGPEAEVVEREMAVYTVKLTAIDMRDPQLLWPVIRWATRHRFRVDGPIYMTWFYPFYCNNVPERYVQIILPIDIM